MITMIFFRFIAVLCPILLFIAINAYAENKRGDINEYLVEYAHNKDNWPALHYAIEKERPDVVIEILQLFPEQAVFYTPSIKLMDSYCGNSAGDDYDYQVGAEKGISALELAVRKGYVELAKTLLELGCNPCEVRTEYFGYISDHWEQRKGSFIYEKVKFINSFLKESNYWTRSIIYWAIESDNEEMVKLLLDAGVSLDCIKAQRTWCTDVNVNIERTSIHHAAYTGSDKILHSLISYQMDGEKWKDRFLDAKILETFRIYAKDDSGLPLLHSALKNSDREAFNILLKYGEFMRWRGRAPKSLLAMAVACDDYFFLELMLSHGFNTNDAMIELVSQNKINYIKNLLQFIVLNEESAKILESAVLQGHADIVVELINHGIRSSHAIKLAIEARRLDLTAYLIEAGQVNFSQLTGLDTAMRHRMVSMVELLVKVQFQKDRAAQDGLLSLAIRSKDQKIFTLLEEAGYWDSGVWNAFVDTNEVGMLHIYLQNKIHAKALIAEITSMKKRAIEQECQEMLAYLRTL
jgi:ankyrin repeat protein